MKKTLTALLALLCLIAKTQQATTTSSYPMVAPEFQNSIKEFASPVIQQPATFSSTVIWSEDFSNGIPPTWGQNGTPAAANWEYRGPSTNPDNTTGSRGAFAGNGSPINSTTATNGFVIFDSDYLDNGGATLPNGSPDPSQGIANSPHIGRLTTNVIDLSMYPDVELKFESDVRRFQCAFFIAFSTDGGLTFPDTVEYYPEAELAVNASRIYRNTTTNVSSIIGGQSQVTMQFIFDGTVSNANGSGYYHWMLDDIELRSAPDHKLTFTTYGAAPATDLIYNNDPDYPRYGTLHTNQLVPLSFDANLINNGASTQTNVGLAVEIRDAGTNALITTVQTSSGCANLLPGDTCNYSSLTTSNWMPPGVSREYIFVYKPISDSIPISQPTDTDTVIQTVSSHYYSLARNQIGNYVGTNSTNPDIIAMSFLASLENENPDSIGSGKNYLEGIDIYFSNLTDPTANMEVAIYDSAGYPQGFNTPVYTKIFTFNSGTPGGRAYFSFKTFNGTDSVPLALNTGSYYIQCTFYPNAPNGVVRIANDASHDQGSNSLMQLADGSWYNGFSSSTYEAPQIRLITLAPTACFNGSTINASICSSGGSYTSPSGNVYTTAGTYYDTIAVANSCDSTFVINVQVGTSSQDSISPVICGTSYTSPSGNTYTQSGIYQDTLVSSVGCDSVITIDLSLNTNSSSNVSVTTCDSIYISPSGNHIYTQSGVYQDTIQNSVGCDSLLSVNVLFFNPPNVSITRAGDTLTVGSNSAVNYQWYRCDTGFTAIAGASKQTLTLQDTGTYAVVVDNGNCEDTSACIYIQGIDIESSSLNPNLMLYPNPSTGKVTIDLGAVYSDVEIKVFAMDGRTVHSTSYKSAAKLDLLLTAPAGTYILELATASGQVTRKQLVLKP